MRAMSPGSTWECGSFILGCGTFGGIGGSPRLIGRGLDEASAFATMDEAIAMGITLFDTAGSYAAGASETMIGRWLMERGPSRSDGIRISTKVGPPRGNEGDQRFDAAFLDRKFAGSLHRLGVTSVELLLTHAPDDNTPVEYTLEGLEAIRANGRCRFVGACNVDAEQLTAALDAAERLGIDHYRVVQNGYCLLEPENDLAVRSICSERGIAYTPFSPLAGGVLTGKYHRDMPAPADSRMALRPDGTDELLTPAVHDAIDRLKSDAELRRGTSCGALALAWLLNHPGVTSIVAGPSNRPPHLQLAAQARNISMTKSDFDEIASWFVSATARK
ncbi:MAG: aldo/keto reductase [Casimicrobiaceae bacterium]